MGFTPEPTNLVEDFRHGGVGVTTSSFTAAVIGHVNHGKTALVRALTGIETDRLKEERERGLSITLGFAWRDYGTGSLDLIDAPGHEDFIRAMVVGTAGARAVLLVVSAVEGFGRQTLQHLEIAALLGITTGVVAVTKSDLLSSESEVVLRAQIAETLAESFLAGAPVVFCSALTGAGLEALHRELGAFVARAPPVETLAGAYLPIDRAFSLDGTGTVITGTLLGGRLTIPDEAVLEPSGRRVDLRQIQRHGETLQSVQPGGRVAVNLRGVSAQDIKSGEVLCTSATFVAALQVDAWVSMSSDNTRPLKHMDELRVMWGARQDIATVRLYGDKLIEPGGAGLAQLRFAGPVVAYGGQRAVLRRLSPAGTVGGALVLDPEAPPARGKMAPRREVLEAVLAGDVRRVAAALAQRDREIVSVAELARLWRRSVDEVRQALETDYAALDEARLIRRAVLAQVRNAYLQQLSAAHVRAPTKSTHPVSAVRTALAQHMSRDLAAHVEQSLADAGEIKLAADQVALPGYDPFAALSPQTLQRVGEIEVEFQTVGLMAPHAGLLTGWLLEDQDLIRLLTDSGRLIALRNNALRQTLYLHASALEIALVALTATFSPPLAFTTGEARAALATTRKFIVPVLEALDALGQTKRDGDLRTVIPKNAFPPLPIPL